MSIFMTGSCVGWGACDLGPAPKCDQPKDGRCNLYKSILISARVDASVPGSALESAQRLLAPFFAPDRLVLRRLGGEAMAMKVSSACVVPRRLPVLMNSSRRPSKTAMQSMAIGPLRSDSDIARRLIACH